MTESLSFSGVLPYSITEQRIVISIRLVPRTSVPFSVDALLDSGAEISNFDRNVARRLGITDLSTGMPIQVASASQAATSDTGYIHDIDIVVFGRPVTIPIVFCPTWPEGTPNLLGMEGFFDHWVFAIDHSRRRLHYEPAT